MDDLDLTFLKTLNPFIVMGHREEVGYKELGKNSKVLIWLIFHLVNISENRGKNLIGYHGSPD